MPLNVSLQQPSNTQHNIHRVKKRITPLLIASDDKGTQSNEIQSQSSQSNDSLFDSTDLRQQFISTKEQDGQHTLYEQHASNENGEKTFVDTKISHKSKLSRREHEIIDSFYGLLFPKYIIQQQWNLLMQKKKYFYKPSKFDSESDMMSMKSKNDVSELDDNVLKSNNDEFNQVLELNSEVAEPNNDETEPNNDDTELYIDDTELDFDDMNSNVVDTELNTHNFKNAKNLAEVHTEEGTGLGGVNTVGDAGLASNISTKGVNTDDLCIDEVIPLRLSTASSIYLSGVFHYLTYELLNLSTTCVSINTNRVLKLKNQSLHSKNDNILTYYGDSQHGNNQDNSSNNTTTTNTRISNSKTTTATTKTNSTITDNTIATAVTNNINDSNNTTSLPTGQVDSEWFCPPVKRVKKPHTNKIPSTTLETQISLPIVDKDTTNNSNSTMTIDMKECNQNITKSEPVSDDNNDLGLTNNKSNKYQQSPHMSEMPTPSSVTNNLTQEQIKSLFCITPEILDFIFENDKEFKELSVKRKFK